MSLSRTGWAASSLVLALVAVPAAGQSCRDTTLLAPADGATVAGVRPELAWRALSDVKRYRVQVESRLPEGQVIARIDTVVEGTRLLPPVALAVTRAAVKVVVTADCGAEAPPVTARGPTFFIETASACAAPADVSVKDGALSWNASGAVGYVIAAFARDGKVFMRQEMRGTSVRLPQGAAYASVRARCADGLSPAVYGVPGSG